MRRCSSRGRRLAYALLSGYVAIAACALWVGLGEPRSAQRTISNDDALAVQHRLLLRSDAEHQLALRIAPSLLRERRVSVAIERRYMEAMELKGTQPQLLAARFNGDQVVLDFPVDVRERPLVVKLMLRTLRAGAPAGEVAVLGGPAVHVRHFVSP